MEDRIPAPSVAKLAAVFHVIPAHLMLLKASPGSGRITQGGSAIIFAEDNAIQFQEMNADQDVVHSSAAETMQENGGPIL